MLRNEACLPMVAALLLTLSACGPARPAVAPVSGRITVSGKPVTTGVVWFYPDAGRAATGLIDADGRYTLGTFARADGALAGDHRVVIEAREILQPQVRRTPIKSDIPTDLPESIKQEWAAASASAGDAKIKWLVPERYAGVATSPLRATVNPGPNTIDFDLPSP
jgi:hypothetical protein